jgi:YegS/Rv2252/BmrU family lipid kinase
MMRAYVILNPVAGQKDPEEVKTILKGAQEDGHLDYTLYETTGKEDLKEIVAEAIQENYDCFVACGGDGTVSGVVDGLAGTDLPLAILPRGTANAFATELGISKNLEEAFQLLTGPHQVKAVDLIQNGSRYYLLECSVGFTSRAIAGVSREEKNRLGWLPYVWKGVKNFIGVDDIRFDLSVDGESLHTKANELVLFNTSQIGIINEHLDTDIHIDDGRQELYALHSKSLWDMLVILYYRLLGDAKKASHIQFWPVKHEVEINSRPQLQFQADGDLMEKTPVTLKVAKGAIRVLVPES